MAARRLIIVMLVLLGVSTAIAIVAPDPVEQTAETGQTGSTGATGEAAGDDGTTGETGETGTTEAPAGGGSDPGQDATGGEVSPEEGPPSELDLSNEGSTVSITTTVGEGTVAVCVRPENRLILTLRTQRTLDISIPDFGRTDTATRFSPAVFDLLLPTDPGGFAVEELAGGRRLATINSTAGCGPVGVTRSR